jgi:hypothetical protein
VAQVPILVFSRSDLEHKRLLQGGAHFHVAPSRGTVHRRADLRCHDSHMQMYMVVAWALGHVSWLMVILIVVGRFLLGFPKVNIIVDLYYTCMEYLLCHGLTSRD